MILEDGKPARRSTPARWLDFLFSLFAGLGVVMFFCAFWAILSKGVGEFILPSPKGVFIKAFEILLEWKSYELDISLYRAFFGCIFAVLAGSLLGVIAYFYKSFLIFARPLVSMFLGIAPIIWIVLAIFWFGFGSFSTVFVVVIASFALSFGSTLNSLMSIPGNIKDLCFVYKLNLSSRIFDVYFPYMLRQLLPALLIAFSNGIKLTLMAELLGANTGLGSKLAQARAYLDTQSVLAFVVLSVALIYIFDIFIIKPLELSFIKDGT